MRCLYNGSGIISWNINGIIYGNRDTIPFYSRMFINNGQEITTSVKLYLNGTTYQCILSQSSSTFRSDTGILLIGMNIVSLNNVVRTKSLLVLFTINITILLMLSRVETRGLNETLQCKTHLIYNLFGIISILKLALGGYEHDLLPAASLQ